MMLYKSLGRKKSFGLWVWHKLFGGSMKKRGYILLGFGYLGGLVEIAAAGVSGEAIAERNSVFQVTYTLKPSCKTTKYKDLEKREEKREEFEYRSLLLQEKLHLSAGLVADIYKKGPGTIINIAYSLVKLTNNQEDKPDKDSSSYEHYPPLCENCYKVMAILYPTIGQNKNIKCSHDGCKGANNKFEWKSLTNHLPTLADYVETNLSKSEINKLLKGLNLMTMEDNDTCVHFFMSCYQGDAGKAESYLEKVSAIGLRDPRRVSEVLYICATKVGFIKVIKFLVEKAGGNVNRSYEEKIKTPIMGALVNRHKDTWRYVMYMAKQQGIDLTLFVTVKNEQLSILDYVFQYVKEKEAKQEDVLELAEHLLVKNREISNKAYKMCVNELLRTCCALPNFLGFMKRLVKEEDALINYKGFGNKTVPIRSLEFNHSDSLRYFKYFFEVGNIDCSCVFEENEQGISLFDLLLNYAQGEDKKEVLNMANVLIKKGGSQEIQKLYTNRALMGACCFPNLGDYMKLLVEGLGADVNYMVDQMTPVLRVLKVEHKDSWKYLMYLHEQGGVNPYLKVKGKESKVCLNFFDWLVDCAIVHNNQEKVFPFMKSLYEQRKEKNDTKMRLKRLFTDALSVFCSYPRFGKVVELCIKNGADLNYREKGTPLIMPMKVLMSTNMILVQNEDDGTTKLYDKDVFEYLGYMLRCPNIKYSLIVQDDNDGSYFNLLEMLVFNTKGKHQKKFVELIEILHNSNPLQKKDLTYLKNRKLFTSDNKFVLRRLQEMVGKSKKKHVSNKKKSKRKKQK